jgi:integrase
MPRHLRNPKVESRTARAKLKPSLKPTYFDLGGKLHLGYRRGKGAGAWVGRRYLGNEKYATATLAEADDLADADGVGVLTFNQAQMRARAWASERDQEERLAALGPVITVKIAMREYLEERATFRDAIGKLKHLAPLAETPLASLTVADLKQWRAGLLSEMTEASAMRVANDARACLNDAAKRHRDKLPAEVRETIKDGFAAARGVKVENDRPKQLLSDADIRRVIDAAYKVDDAHGWGGDLARMVLVLGATGGRFSQVQRLRVVDLQVAEGRLMMPSSRKGSGSKASHTPVPVGTDIVNALRRSTAGRKGHEPLLLRPKWRREPGPGLGVLKIYARGPWRAASAITRPWKMIVKRAGLPDDLVAYSLRHSSIVRMLRAGLPVQLVARLHDSSSVMLERFYTTYITDALDGLARAALVPLVPTQPVPMRVEG